MYQRKCPCCNEAVVYKKRHIYIRAERENRKCSSHCNGRKPKDICHKICTRCRIEKPVNLFENQSICKNCDSDNNSNKTTAKYCPYCKLTKKADEFTKCSATKDGLQKKCKICQSKYHARYFQKNKSKIMKKRSSYKKAYSKTARGKYHKYTWSSKKRNISFNLTFGEFNDIVSKPCWYCGEFSDEIELCGVDRLDNNLGYTVDNCIPCCTFCNQAKSNYSLNYFLYKIYIIANKTNL